MSIIVRPQEAIVHYPPFQTDYHGSDRRDLRGRRRRAQRELEQFRLVLRRTRAHQEDDLFIGELRGRDEGGRGRGKRAGGERLLFRLLNRGL